MGGSHEVAWRSNESGLRSTKGSRRPATKHILRVAAWAPYNIIQPAVSPDSKEELTNGGSVTTADRRGADQEAHTRCELIYVKKERSVAQS